MPLTTTGEPGHYDLLSDNIYLWMERGRPAPRCYHYRRGPAGLLGIGLGRFAVARHLLSGKRASSV
jgi:hypothetical protein